MSKRDPPPNHTTFSSSLLNEIFLSIDHDPPAADSNIRRLLDHDRKMSSLRRSRLVHKWMDKPSFDDLIVPPPPPPRQRPPPPPPPPVVPAALDEDPDSFFSTTSVSSSDSSFASTASEAEAPPSFDSSSKPKTSCFGPLRAPKPVKTKAKSSNSDQFHEDCSTNKSSSSSRALKIYSQLKSLKQPISPGIKLAKYINSLFIKEASATSRKKKATKSDSFQGKFRGVPAPERRYKSEQTSPEWPIPLTSSFTKRETSASIPTNATSAASDHKAALVKRYEELRRLKIGDIEEEVDMNRKVLEEVALDLLNNYWNRRKMENGDDDDNNNDKDDSSCSSSDLFEIDHLSLIGNEELPVYETTRIRS